MELAPRAQYDWVMTIKRDATNLAEPKTLLGRFIREQRNARGWSQDDVASRTGLGITFTTISNVERGRTVLPDPPTMIGIARAFDMHVCELYEAAGYPEFGDTLPERAQVVRLVRELDTPERLAQVRKQLEFLRGDEGVLRKSAGKPGSPTSAAPVASDEPAGITKR